MINRRLVLLAATAGALAAYTAWSDGGDLLRRLAGGTPAPSKAVQIAALPPKEFVAADRGTPILNPLHGLAIESLDEIVARPLFNPSRAPAPKQEPSAPAPFVEVEAAGTVESAIDPADFTLLAVASDGTERIALVRWNSANQVFHLKEGERLSDLQVLQVGERDIVFGRDGNSFELRLFEKPTRSPDGESADAPPAATGNGPTVVPEQQ